MPAIRFVTLGDGKRVPLGLYVATWRHLLGEPPDREYDRSLCESFPATAHEILAQFMNGLVDRINRHDPRYGRGRKWDPDWQHHAHNDARAINDASRRRVIHWTSEITTDDWRTRFAHVLTGVGEE